MVRCPVPPLLLSLAAALASIGWAAAQTTDEPPLSLGTIMAHPDWIGRPPEAPYWADDASAVYYLQRRENQDVRPPQEDDPAFELMRIDLADGTAAAVATGDLGRVDVAGGSLDLARTNKVYGRQGDIYIKDLRSGAIRQLTRTDEPESDPLFLTDGRVGYRRGSQYFLRDLPSGLEEQPFDIRLERDPRAIQEEKDEKADYLERQQRRLFDVLREREERRQRNEDLARAERRSDATRPAPPYFLGEKLDIRTLSPSPSGDWLLAVVAAKDPEEGRKATMPRYVTNSGYVETAEIRTKVGTGKPERQRLFLLDRRRGEARELDLSVLPGIDEDPLADLRAAAAKRERAAATEDAGAPTPGAAGEPTKPAKEKTRPVALSHLRWSDDGRRVAFQAFSQDNKDRWLATVDLEAAAVRPLHRMHDDAWINWDFRDIGWLRDNRTLFFLSEQSGYSQLYLVAADGDGEPHALTSGNFVVDAPSLSPDGRFLYYTANHNHPGIYEVWRVEIESGRSERLTTLGGRNQYVLSPDGERLLLVHSSMTRPPELWLQDAVPGAVARQITRITSGQFLASSWTEPQVVEVPSSRVERPIYSRLYLPTGQSLAGGLRPAVVFIHGAGYLQNADQGWSSYFREFMFHTLLTRHGYVVLDMDYRGSAGYGRDWRTAIYRQMGTPEVEDLADGVAWLVEHHGVDPQRVGVYGGSYGGFLTFMAMFKQPDLFAAGAALRPVTDWAHYNHPYTSNILNTPDLDPEAYERSSPIELAQGLAKPLLICTGMLDDNVLFQDSVRLVQRLIELEKENWEIAIYPMEPHGFREPSSWLDEYRRIYKLFETHLQ